METFNNFYNQKREQIFVNELDAMCETLALANVPFETFWAKVGLPVLAEQGFSDATDLLEQWGHRFLEGPFDFGAPALHNPAYTSQKKSGFWGGLKNKLAGLRSGKQEAPSQNMPPVGPGGGDNFGGVNLTGQNARNRSGEGGVDMSKAGVDSRNKLARVIDPVKADFLKFITNSISHFVGNLENQGIQGNKQMYSIANAFKRGHFDQVLAKSLSGPISQSFDQFVKQSGLHSRARNAQDDERYNQARGQFGQGATAAAAPGSASFTGAKPDQATGRFLPTSSSGWGGNLNTHNAPEPSAIPPRGPVDQAKLAPVQRGEPISEPEEAPVKQKRPAPKPKPPNQKKGGNQGKGRNKSKKSRK